MSADSLQMFFSTANQYYIAGRFGALAGLVPVVGNLLHHAVEMYLKGALSKTKTLAELKNLGHCLPNVWSEFKAQVKDPALDRLDGVVAALHSFEELRYPDSVLAKGMSCTVSITRPSAAGSSGGAAATVPQYGVCLEEIDELVARVYVVASVNPKFFFGGLNKVAKEYLTQENAAI